MKWNQLYNDSDFKSIRCSDIWQKMAMHKIAQELMNKKEIKELKNQGFEIDTDSSDKHILDLKNPSNRIYIGVQYFHSLALLEIKYRTDENCMFVIQQQGNSLCAGIDVLKNRSDYLGNIYRKRKDNKEWSEKVNENLFQVFNLIYILANSGNIIVDNNNNKTNRVKETYEANVINALKEPAMRYMIFISDKSNGDVLAYESEKSGFYYKNISLTKNNVDSTINDTLEYMVECLKRAIIIYPPQK